MIRGERVLLRPLTDDDWERVEGWGRHREGLWGPYQRFQMDHLPELKRAYESTGLLRRDSGFLAIEPVERGGAVGFVRYTMLNFPDSDMPQPEIGVGLDQSARGRGYGSEACKLLVDYLFGGYPVERITALTDVENAPCRGMLERLGFSCEGVMRRATFRDGRWRDLALYGILRDEWKERGA
jgi:aminoglycoside 6'-N-acetyltransferase